MRKILVCQHVAYEILGTLNPLLKKHGFRMHYVNFGRHPTLQLSLENYQGLVILGGPMTLDQADQYEHLSHEIELIQDAISRDLPVLGICLGAQLIAAALGARVGPNPCKEIGWYEVRLTESGKKDLVMSHFKESEMIFQWHGDTFDIPDGAVHLAKTKECPNQAFRYGDNTYAFQFHVEVDEALIERWLHVPHHMNELASLKGKIDPEQIRKDTKRYIERLKELSEQTFCEFIRLFGKKARYRRLPSI